MQITTNNTTFPDFSFDIIETNTDSVIINIADTDYEVPIDVDFEDIERIEGDRVTGYFRQEWNAETMSEGDLRKEINKNYIYRKVI